MASSLVGKLSFTCWRVSAEEVQPISGSTVRGWEASNSTVQWSYFALPDCMALREGL